jgi:hypothetical protein
MAYVINYNPSQHDLYNFPSGPTIDPTDWRNNRQVSGVCYNSNLYIKNAGACGFTFFIDFSGMDVRPRGCPAYGFDQYANNAGYTYSGLCFNSPTSYTYPYILTSFNGVFPDPISEPGSILTQTQQLAYYYPGIPTADFTVAKNYNCWNNGVFAKILISPKHFISTLHFTGSNYIQGGSVKFIGKNNQEYYKTFNTAFIFSPFNVNGNAPGYPQGYNFPSLAQDLHLFELTEELTEEELEQIKVYDLIDISSVPSTVPIFRVNPQGVVTVVTENPLRGFTSYYNPSTNTSVPYYGYNAGGISFAFETLWSGDSGTPTFVWDPVLQDTCFYKLYFGGNGYDTRFPNVSQTYTALQKWIHDQIGYTIGLITYNQQPPPSGPETFYANGLTYTLGATVAAVPGNAGTTRGIISGLDQGVTYNFIVVAYNANGFSGYAIINDVHIPPLEIDGDGPILDV